MKRSLSGENDQTSKVPKILCKDWQRSIVIQQALDNYDALIRINPFAIDKGIKGIAGTLKMIKKFECSKKF